MNIETRCFMLNKNTTKKFNFRFCKTLIFVKCWNVSLRQSLFHFFNIKIIQKFVITNCSNGILVPFGIMIPFGGFEPSLRIGTWPLLCHHPKASKGSLEPRPRIQPPSSLVHGIWYWWQEVFQTAIESEGLVSGFQVAGRTMNNFGPIILGVFFFLLMLQPHPYIV